MEKLYRFHRARIINVAAAIDDQQTAQNLVKKQGYKDLAKRRQAHNIALENEQFYQRLSRAEKKVSSITEDNIKHNKLTNGVKSHITRLNCKVRVRKLTQIQKENEYFLHRLQQARPEMSLQSVDTWYKGHVKFREGR